MARNNRKCICCSAEYRYCNSCSEDKLKESWYTIYHNENCRNIYNIISNYISGRITKEEAKEKLDKCDLSYKDKLKEKMVEVISKIYEVDNVVLESVNTEKTPEINKEEVIKARPRHSKKIIVEDNN
jgi:uncharacterized phage-associated protein